MSVRVTFGSKRMLSYFSVLACWVRTSSVARMPDKRRFLNCEPPGGGTLRSSRRDVRRCPTGCLAPRLPRRADRAVAAKRQWVRAQAHRFHTSGSVGGASRGAPSFCFPSCPHRALGTPAAAQTGFGLPGLPRRSAGSAGRLGLPHAAAAQAARGSRRQAAADAGRSAGNQGRRRAARHRAGPADRHPDGTGAGRRQRGRLQRFLERRRGPPRG